MDTFKEVKASLNAAQKTAVDQLDGPMMVIAGPGTGKTQLLSARVANILDKTDTLPQNILCLTFTESGARNMRERLASFIGKSAYDVNISTYHGFGTELIRHYPEFIDGLSLEKPIDDIGKREVLTKIIDKLPYSSPLKSQRYTIRDLASTISELKRALMSPDDIEAIAAENEKQIRSLSSETKKIFSDFKVMPRKYEKAVKYFDQTQSALRKYKHGLARQASDELGSALEEAAEANSTKPLTKWKNTWLHKDSAGNFAFTRRFVNEKFSALAGVLNSYNQALADKGLYDYDDMILRSIQAMQDHDELKFNLQERYQYILLDEFQDTNAAQFELVRLLADSPVHEGRPNVMAVGDDDQAIYAFQGARSSNMLDFINAFREPSVINLTKNYRSHPDIIHTAHNVAGQIESRLHNSLEGVDKTLEASSNSLPADSTIERREFASPSDENSWVAAKVKELIDSGVSAEEITLLAPKHKYLEAIVPYLNNRGVPVTYEKRENILHTPIVMQLRIMSQLLMAIAADDTAAMNHLFPQVLSMEFFELPVQNIWQTNWQSTKKEEKRSWAEIASEDDKLSRHVWFLLQLASNMQQLTLEQTLDALTGAAELDISDEPYTSPMKSYYFSDDKKEEYSLEYYENLSHLSVIREKLREHQQSYDSQLTLGDFVDFIDSYDEAEEPMLNTHPIAQAESAVTLQTVFKAKGLEYEYVFLLSCHDDVWGSAARGNFNKLSLPANVTHVRYAGANEDERLRLLYVAITRAKHGLFLTSYSESDSGKTSVPVKYFDEYETDGKVHAHILPSELSAITRSNQTALDVAAQGIELGWNPGASEITPSLKSLLTERLVKYQMSPTHLNTFIDLEWGGPDTFLLNTLLRFPQAPGIDGEFGNAVHASLDWYQNEINKGNSPKTIDVISYFEKDISSRYIPRSELNLLKQRGKEALTAYLKDRGATFTEGELSEVSFRGEGVFVGDAHLAGNIDKLELDKKNKKATVVDFKTGKIAKKGSLKLLKYKQQLLFYKLLVEGSHTYSGCKVDKGRIEYIEPDEEGNIVSQEFEFNDKDLADLKKLIRAVWVKINDLDFPDTEKYNNSVAGSKKFISELIN